MRANAYCAHLSIRDHWALRSISRCPDQVVYLKCNPQYLVHKQAWYSFYRLTEGMKSLVDLAQPTPRGVDEARG
ncbi:hypothetical protein TNCV_288441 [Trichonephila clavipes]|nr:hypothetical protein TNCV_288441 [Trichonephila clavipes]